MVSSKFGQKSITEISNTSCAIAFIIGFFWITALYGEEEKFPLGPDSIRQDGVPRGLVEKWRLESDVYRNTVRDYWIYVPEQYDSTQPTRVMVFQDGQAYVDEEGWFRVPIVLDNLIHKKELPVIIAVFINPGHKGDEPPEKGWQASNRSDEYDTLGAKYSSFLLDEVLPEIGKEYNLSDKAEHRAIAGISSGGICAFTVAWHRPDAFSKVLSHVGSFTNIRGGNAYPDLIRLANKKPIRVFLQAGRNDLNILVGDWWLANLQMESALKFKGYDYKFAGGDGGHDGLHGGAILPDSLRWLWREDGE